MLSKISLIILLSITNIYAISWNKIDADSNPLNNINSYTYLFEDFDGDRDLDLYEYNGISDNYYLNNGDGSFTLKTDINNPFRDINTSIDMNYPSHGNTVLIDMDDDGDIDIFFAKDGYFEYYLNTDGSTYERKIDSQNPFNLIAVSGDTFLYDDFDSDGDSDLYVYNGVNDNFYENNGDNSFILDTNNLHPFRNVNSSLLYPSYGNTVVQDLDNDGDLDILFAKDGVIRYFENSDGSTYEEKVDIANPFNAISVSYNTFLFTDFDDDGDSDLYVYDGEDDKFYKNNGFNSYALVSNDDNPLDPVTSTLLYSDKEDTIVCDYNNDGDIDLFYLDSNNTYIYHSLVNSPPEIDFIGDLSKLEDSDDFNITLSATDEEGDIIVFSVSSSDTSIATVSIVDNKINIIPQLDAYGIVTIEVNATAGSKTSTLTFDVTITPLNDAPTINTQFSNLEIQKNEGVVIFDLNVSDVEGDDLNVTVDVDNTILTSSINWTNYLSQGAYDGVTLDFSLTTHNISGVAKVTIIANDGDKNTTKMFDVNIINPSFVIGPAIYYLLSN